MEIFYNNEHSGYEEIVSYGPKWWTEYREMDANYKFAGWTLDLMSHWLERVINNVFPVYADEKTISLFESILGIEPYAEETIEERRRAVSVNYSIANKLSKSTIKELIKVYTGRDGDVYNKAGCLVIELNDYDSHYVSIDSLAKAIDKRMPAHLLYKILMKLRYEQNLTFACVLREYKITGITDYHEYNPLDGYYWFCDGDEIPFVDENGDILTEGGTSYE